MQKTTIAYVGELTIYTEVYLRQALMRTSLRCMREKYTVKGSPTFLSA